jgi:glycerol-3-phosphate acyltransferase PlsY
MFFGLAGAWLVTWLVTAQAQPEASLPAEVAVSRLFNTSQFLLTVSVTIFGLTVIFIQFIVILRHQRAFLL